MYVQNVHLWLKHKLASVLVIGQLYHQSATAPGCTTQLWDVHGLPLFVTRSSLKPVLCTFLDKFFIFLRFLFLSANFRISRRARLPFDFHEFQSKLCLLQFHFEIFTKLFTVLNFT